MLETTEKAIVAIQNSIVNFAFAREGLLKLRAIAVGVEKERVENALAKNQQAADTMQRKLEAEINRLKKQRERR